MLVIYVPFYSDTPCKFIWSGFFNYLADFGFKHILWVYSGRRGVHCWIFDERARILSAEARKAIVSYLELLKGGTHQQRKVNIKTSILPPSLE